MKIGFEKLILYFVFVFLIVSCETKGTPLPLVQPTETTTNIHARIIETSTPIPIPTNIIPTITIRPTLGIDKTFGYTVGLLKTDNLCDLPCFWTVTPGEPWSLARQRLNYFVPYISDTQQDASTILHQIPSNVGLGKLGISFNISILEKNDVVENISAQLMGNDFVESLKTFTPKEIFSKYGAPEEILLFVSNDSMVPEYQFFHLWLVYEEKNFFVLYSGYATKNQDVYQICPTTQHFEREGYSDKYGTVEFASVIGKGRNTMHDFMFKKYAPMNFPYTHSKILESVTEFNNDEFANLFLSNGAACFPTPIKMWNVSTK